MATAPGRRTAPRAVLPIVNPQDHDRWARGIARGVCQDVHTKLHDPRFHKKSDAERELEQTAYLTVVRLTRRYDVRRLPPGGDLVGAFRGYAAKWVRSECRREAARIRNGGLYRTARPELVRELKVDALPQPRCESCSDAQGYMPPALVVYDPDPDPGADEREESMYDTTVEPGMEAQRPKRKWKGKK